MKKILSLLLVLLLLTGCAGKIEPVSEPEADGPPTAQEQKSEPEQSPEPEPKPEPPDLNSVAVPELPGFFDLTALPHLEGLSVSGAMLGERGTLYLLTGELGNELVCFDLNTGALTQLCTIPIPAGVDWVSTALLSAEPLVIVVSAFGLESAYVVSEDGTITCIASTETGYLSQWDSRCTQDALIWLDTDTAQLFSASLDGENSKLLCQIPTDYYYARLSGITADQTEALVSADRGNSDEVVLTISLATGQITHVYRQNDPDPVPTLTGETSLYTVSYDDWISYDLTAQDAQREVNAHVDLSQLIPAFNPEDGMNWGLNVRQDCPFWGKALVVLEHYDGDRRLLLWDYEGQSLRISSPVQPEEYTPPEPVTFEELEERIHGLEETYGIAIYTGDDMNAPYPDYTLSPCDDADAAADALDALEETFALYPEDYFRQLGGDSIRGFNFYLCGRMTPTDPTVSIDSPGGLSCLVDGVELLAFDITGYVRTQDVVHELTHVLDHWLWEDDVLVESEWAAMNPEDFSYYNAYVNPEGESYEWAGSTRYTTWDDAYYDRDYDSVYFIDPYSTTYPTEDRARLMEYLLSDPEHDPPDYFQSVHLQEKLNYYFQCIRTKFDDSAWPEQASWEAALAQRANQN